MKLDRYELKAGNNLTTFEFISEGPKGQIPKLIQFTPTNYKDLYNLAFGDKNSETEQIDDIVISNNGDSELVLATVVATLYAFTDKYPDTLVYATGSTKARTRLYRMGISKYFGDAQSDFEIFGQIHNEWEPFAKGTDYEAFVVKRKLFNFEV
ncbi:DUF6934 family protein [Mucilaginibacter sp. McL0603]|uniref:DUF6934 family protein n=1 Tax=Mucilaginibacter sp. McL0603 TaxID=3415670 RepID=UPI003CF80A6A